MLSNGSPVSKKRSEPISSTPEVTVQDSTSTSQDHQSQIKISPFLRSRFRANQRQPDDIVTHSDTIKQMVNGLALSRPAPENFSIEELRAQVRRDFRGNIPEEGTGTTPNLKSSTTHGFIPSGGTATTPSSADDERYHNSDAANSTRVVVEAAEFHRMKQALDTAQERIARMDEELLQNRLTNVTINNAMSPASEQDFPGPSDVTDQTMRHLQRTLNASTRPAVLRSDTWNTNDDIRADSAATFLGSNAFGRGQAIWGSSNYASGGASGFNSLSTTNQEASSSSWNNSGSPYSSSRNEFMSAPVLLPSPPLPVGLFPLPYENRRGVSPDSIAPAPTPFTNDFSYRRSSASPSRVVSPLDSTQPTNRWVSYGNETSLMEQRAPGSMGYQPIGAFHATIPFVPRPVGSRLSPTAPEFNYDQMASSGPWNAQASHPSSSNAHLTPAEPMNYRRLLDRNMSCNWKYIVDKIVCNNDQQASIFLQQKLKVGTPEQKHEIIEAIIAQAYQLMINRFGNFLVQRCFEHGTHEQVIAIANSIRGNTLALSMDAFGCHVVQKAFDCVPEDYKAIMVHELLRRIPETVIHRYACHVWQKLFELRWSDTPPQIMKYVNEALRGMWHEVALGETGSLVVQNIFENCLEEDKRPCINEVLASIDVVAHGQFGNWCIQHICEHGSKSDRTRAIDHILRFASDYSTDQYASKVIEKCLKIGGSEFLERYLERVCEGRPDRPRMPLIDIAADQFGNYLVQWILSNASPQHREVVACHVRKHMVSLRGSKYGSRVAMLCCNPASAIRPGAPSSMQLNRPFNAPGFANTRQNYGGGFR